MTEARRLVEVQGAWLGNAGAELMLRTLSVRLRERFPDLQIGMDRRWGTAQSLRRVGALRLVPRRVARAPGYARLVSRGLRAGGAPIRRLAHACDLAVRDECAALLDVSGFAIGDQWGPMKARSRADAVQEYEKRGRPVVFLPQAFGPFRNELVETEFRRIVEHADLVLARDHVSMDFAERVVGSGRVRVVPDITFDCPTPPPAATTGTYGVVVPNGRVVDRGAWVHDEYVRALVEAGELMKAEYGSVEVLTHAGEDADRRLASEIADLLACSVTNAADPMTLRARLGAARLVVASRYHALVGGLAAGVPVVAIGWSHKYAALLDDFDLPPGIDRPDPPGVRAAVIAAIADEPSRRPRITKRSGEFRREVAGLWEEIAGLIT